MTIRRVLIASRGEIAVRPASAGFLPSPGAISGLRSPAQRGVRVVTTGWLEKRFLPRYPKCSAVAA